eukprot:4697619-Pyramimonas_sp.AAC.1
MGDRGEFDPTLSCLRARRACAQRPSLCSSAPCTHAHAHAHTHTHISPQQYVVARLPLAVKHAAPHALDPVRNKREVTPLALSQTEGDEGPSIPENTSRTTMSFVTGQCRKASSD